MITTTVVLTTAALTFSTFASIYEPKTEVQDYVLLAQANANLNHSQEALTWAERALSIDPDYPAATELACLSNYNVLLDSLPHLPSRPVLEKRCLQCQAVSGFSDQAILITGIYQTLLGDNQTAQKQWQHLVDKNADTAETALAALQLTGGLREKDSEKIAKIPLSKMHPFLLISEALQGNTTAKTHIQTHYTREEQEQYLTIVQSLFLKK